MDHLAILDKKRKLLPKIISGEKTIESRWYKTRRTPYNNIKAGDIIYFKDSGEFVTVKAVVDKALFFADLTEHKIREILKRYAKDIAISPDYSEKYLKYKYITLIFLKNIEEIKPFDIDKTGFGNACAWMTVDDVGKIKNT
jgi:ASC-1-like (ASCH) protein